MFKYIFIPLLLPFLFSSQSFSQWWVTGGNLHWPYGNVSVQKNLGVGLNLTLNDTLFFNDDSSYIMNYRFYEDNELTENYFRFYTFDANYVNEIQFGYSGLLLKRNGPNYFVASPSDLTSINPTGTFSLAGENGAGLIQYTRTIGSVVTKIFIGDGDPEGNVVALPGSLYLSTDGGAQTTFFVKESGTGNTGWVGK